MISKPLKALTCAITLTIATLAGAVAPPAAAAATAPNDALYARQWALRRIGAPTAWKTSQGAGIMIAIVDTGVDRNHEDLKSKVKLQYDSVTDDNFAQDSLGHGTLVAGAAAAATNNKVGIAGVAPKANLMAIRAFPLFNEASGASGADVADGIMWAADHGADVINLSLGSDIPRPESAAALLPAVLYAQAQGALVVAAAGNSALPYCGFPAIYPGVVCVGASDPLDGMASFSNYGLRLDVVAPGQSIWSTGVLRGGGFPTTPDLKYSSVPGTSIASPIVAGVGALLMSMGADNLLAGLIIRASAKEMGLPGYDLTYGFGRVDAAAAVAMCKEIC